MSRLYCFALPPLVIGFASLLPAGEYVLLGRLRRRRRPLPA